MMTAKDITVDSLREIILPGLKAYLEGVASSTPQYAELAMSIADDAARWTLAKWRNDPDAEGAFVHLAAQGKMLKSMVEIREGKRVEHNFVAVGKAVAQVALQSLLAFVNVR